MPAGSLRILRFLCLVSLPPGLRGCRFFLAVHGHSSGEDVRDTRHARIQPCGVKVLVQLDQAPDEGLVAGGERAVQVAVPAATARAKPVEVLLEPGKLAGKLQRAHLASVITVSLQPAGGF
jgi:hypothetical protein